jgi:hypothetical protein
MGLFDFVDPRVYAMKSRLNDPNSPSLLQDMHGEFAEQYLKAIKYGIQFLITQSTWATVPRSEATHVIESTWVFKLKWFPDGSASKFKARFFVCGDLQKEGVDYFETYAPVI